MKMFRIYLWQFFANNIAGFVLMPIRIRTLIYKLLGMEINNNGFEPNIKFYGKNISIGKGTYINQNCYFNNFAKISIGENCFLAPNVSLITPTHEIGDSEKRAGNFYAKEVNIEDGVWVGANVTIMPGVQVGKGCVIGAGSVVTKDCQPNGLYVGIPAKRIRTLN